MKNTVAESLPACSTTSRRARTRCPERPRHATLLLAPQVRKTLGGHWPGARSVVLGSVIVAALPLYGFIVYATFFGSVHYPLPDHRWKLLVLNSAGTAVALVGVAEFALVKVA